jgi:hypothetical protein
MKTFLRVFDYSTAEGTIYRLSELSDVNAMILNASDKGKTDSQWRISFVQMTEEEYTALENA